MCSPSLGLEVLDECASVLPIDEGPGARNRGDPLANGPRGFGWTLRASEGEAQAPLCGRVAVADLDQELGEPLGAERFEVLGVERAFRRHDDVLVSGFEGWVTLWNERQEVRQAGKFSRLKIGCPLIKQISVRLNNEGRAQSGCEHSITRAQKPRKILWPLGDDAQELDSVDVVGSALIANTTWRALCRAGARAHLLRARAAAPLVCSDLRR